jgi:hypothetical protein
MTLRRQPRFIGLDFDNTIVRYDGLFHRACVDKGLIPASVAASKSEVRDYLRAAGREDDWTEMQGEVYGARMAEAEAFPGVFDFMRACTRAGVRLAIVSHKTRYPYRGPRHDIHAAATGWLDLHRVFDDPELGLSRADVYFELSKAEKLARVATIGCDTFVDDLPEILTDAAFPREVQRVLFDPSGTIECAAADQRVSSWNELSQIVIRDAS